MGCGSSGASYSPEQSKDDKRAAFKQKALNPPSTADAYQRQKQRQTAQKEAEKERQMAEKEAEKQKNRVSKIVKDTPLKEHIAEPPVNTLRRVGTVDSRPLPSKRRNSIKGQSRARRASLPSLPGSASPPERPERTPSQLAKAQKDKQPRLEKLSPAGLHQRRGSIPKNPVSPEEYRKVAPQGAAARSDDLQARGFGARKNKDASSKKEAYTIVPNSEHEFSRPDRKNGRGANLNHLVKKGEMLDL